MYNTSEFIKRGEDILKTITYTRPEKKDIFNAFKIDREIKIVILGQDPYPKEGEAHGYAFSSKISVPASLKRMYKINNITSTNGNLQSWVNQGVCLLNCFLTYPNRNKEWTPLIDDFIKWICNTFPRAIFILFGKDAQKKENIITNKKLKCIHPSPLTGNKFLNECDVFNKSNEYIKMNYILERGLECDISPEINWDPNLIKPKRLCLCFTDGSFKSKTKKAGYGIHFPENININEKHEYKNLIKGDISMGIKGTNIVSEGTSILEALKIFKWVRKNIYVDATFIIITDSEFWIRAISGQYNLKKNLELFQSIKKINDTLEKVEYYFVPSHGKECKITYEEFNDLKINHNDLLKFFREGNNKADTLADKAAM